MAIMTLRGECERCGRPLPNGSAEARICTFECTFCSTCTDGELGGICPNCHGNLVLRPTRPVALLDKFPPAATGARPRNPETLTS
jgi:uncharacterized protein